MNKQWSLIVYTVEAALVIAFDRVTKQWALTHSALATTYNPHPTCISFDLVYNRGISWGLFHRPECSTFLLVNGVVITITALVALHALVWFRAQRSIFGHVLIIAGSISNIMDRYWYGGVIDFIHLHYQEWSWAIFNIADVAIVVGALLIALSTLREEKNDSTLV